jgi:hypothetical protein
MSSTNTAAPAPQLDEKILASLIQTNDLSKLSPDQKVAYYSNFCERLGLDPLSQPFNILRLNGKEILYCGRAGVQQLSMLHNVSHKIESRDHVAGCYLVSAKASTPDGRSTESIGAVNIDQLKGESLANAMMKAESKAKRRATLDLLGLGMLDNTEGDALPAGAAVEVKLPAENAKPAPKTVEEKKEQGPRSEQKESAKEEVAPPAKAEVPVQAPAVTEAAEKIQQFTDTLTGFTEVDDLNDFIGVLIGQPEEVRAGIKPILAAKVTELNVAYNITTKKYEDRGVAVDAPAKRDLKWFEDRIGKPVWMQGAKPDQFAGRYLIENEQFPVGMYNTYQEAQGFLFSDWAPSPVKKA